jgi:hypothetical protein
MTTMTTMIAIQMIQSEIKPSSAVFYAYTMRILGVSVCIGRVSTTTERDTMVPVLSVLCIERVFDVYRSVSDVFRRRLNAIPVLCFVSDVYFMCIYVYRTRVHDA